MHYCTPNWELHPWHSSFKKFVQTTTAATFLHARYNNSYTVLHYCKSEPFSSPKESPKVIKMGQHSTFNICEAATNALFVSAKMDLLRAVTFLFITHTLTHIHTYKHATCHYKYPKAKPKHNIHNRKILNKQTVFLCFLLFPPPIICSSHRCYHRHHSLTGNSSCTEGESKDSRE